MSGRSLPVFRAGTVLSGLVPLVLAINSGRLGGLVQLIVVLYAALVAGALFVPVLLGIHRNDVPGEGIVAGMIVGTASVFAWHVFVAAPSALTAGVSAVPPVAVGVASNALIVAVATLRR
jgi:Na+/proline symporter